MEKKRLVLPISIIIGCLILGGFFYLIQISKQKLETEEEKSLIKFLHFIKKNYIYVFIKGKIMAKINYL